MKKILCIGNTCVDVMVRPVDELPETGKLKFVDSITSGVGGCAANAALDLTRLGAPVSIGSAVGKDGFGDLILSRFAGEGLATEGISRFEDIPTAASVVNISSSGERSFLHDPGVTSVYSPKDIPEKLIDECDLLFLTGALIMKSFDGTPAANMLRMAKQKGKITIMDTCWDAEGKWHNKIGPAYPYLDFFMPSIEEAEMLAGSSDPDAICDQLLNEGVKNIIIKHGSRGAYVCEASGKRYWSPAFKRSHVVDTNGAGDAFCAGFLCALAQGRDIADCVRFANATGSFCVTGVGPCSGIPSADTIEQFLETH